jgi:hypothetical protein
MHFSEPVDDKAFEFPPAVFDVTAANRENQLLPPAYRESREIVSKVTNSLEVDVKLQRRL